MSLTIGVVTLRALCQERDEGERHAVTGNKKMREPLVRRVTPS